MTWRRQNKYHAQRATAGPAFPELAGRSFPSRLERDVAVRLLLQQRAGKISDLRYQQTVHLTDADITWRVDFAYTENGETVYHEAKGAETEAYRLKLRLYKTYGTRRLRVTKGARRRTVTREYIPRNYERKSHAK